MNLVNKSNTSTEKLEKIIKFCRLTHRKLPKIIVKNTISNPWSAEFYYNNPYKENYIIARFAQNIAFPFRADDRKSCKGYVFKNYEFFSKTELIIYILSHEFRHAADFENPKTKHLLFFNLQEAEKRADTFALKKLLKYRKLKSAGIDPLK